MCFHILAMESCKYFDRNTFIISVLADFCMSDLIYSQFQVALLFQTLLMATSHSVNLIIYCLSNPAFRKKVYRKYCRQTRSYKSTESNTSPVGYRMPQLRIRRFRSTISKDTCIDATSPLIVSELKRSQSDKPRAGQRRNQRKGVVNLILPSDGLDVTFETTQKKSINRRRASI